MKMITQEIFKKAFQSKFSLIPAVVISLFYPNKALSASFSYAFAQQEITGLKVFVPDPTFPGGRLPSSTVSTISLARVIDTPGGIAGPNVDPTDAMQAYVGPEPVPGENSFAKKGRETPDYARADVELREGRIENGLDGANGENIAESFLGKPISGLFGDEGVAVSSWEITTESFTIPASPIFIDIAFNNELDVEIKDVLGGSSAKANVIFQMQIAGLTNNEVITLFPERLNLERKIETNPFQDKEHVSDLKKHKDSGSLSIMTASLPAGTYEMIFLNQVSVDTNFLHIVPEVRKEHDPIQPGTGDRDNFVQGSVTFDGVSNLSFSDILIDTVILGGGLPSVDDPIEGGTFLIDDTSLLGETSGGEGFSFSDTVFEIQVEDETVLTANLIDNFLFSDAGEKHPAMDSEFQGVVDNIVINNTISSPYLDDLQAFIDEGGENFFSFSSNILSATNNLSIIGSSEGKSWIDGAKKVSEPTSNAYWLVLGTLGAGSAILCKKKQANKKSVSLKREFKDKALVS